MADLVAGVDDDQLTAPTPCTDTTLGDLLDHVGGLSLAFTAAAAKAVGSGAPSPPPSADASNLGNDWRTRIPAALASLGEAWSDEDAWTGMTQAGGVDLPGEVAGLFALDELVVHGWDIARASGPPYAPDEREIAPLFEFLQGLVASGGARQDGLFGPPVAVPAKAPLLDRVLGLTGRDPSWPASR